MHKHILTFDWLEDIVLVQNNSQKKASNFFEAYTLK